MSLPINKVYFPNGLLVLLKEIHTAPLISHWIWYRVGSRNEEPGKSGISHWTEHLLFKGTPQFPSKVMDKIIARQGGFWNALTFLDWTTFFETMPADKIDLALSLEADRMLNSLFELEEVESERTVIISERQGSQNEPLFLLGEAVQAAAYQVHPYGHEIIGSLDDLRTIQRDDLYQHYRTYYIPNNAVLAVAGDFEVEAMLGRVRELYEPIPPGQPPPQDAPVEPLQTEERRVTVEGPGETSYVQAAYHAPAATSPDFFPYIVLDSLLTGPSNLNMFGGGLSNKTSRLYRALVEGELAVSVSGGLPATIDPFLHNILVTVHPQARAEQVGSVLDDEIRRLQDMPPRKEEVARAVKQATALFAYGSESITNQALWLGYSEMFDSYDWFVNYLDNLAEVTPADVQRVAQTYLRPENRVLGIYLPGKNEKVSP